MPPTTTAAAAAAAAAAASKSLSSLLLSRRTSKTFLPHVLPSSTVSSILQVTLASPTAFNLQPYSLLLVTTPEEKEQLKPAMLGGNGTRVTTSSLTAVLLADLQPSLRIPRILRMERESGARAEEYLAHLPVSASFFTGEGGHLSNLLKDAALAAISPSKPVPRPSKVEGWSYKNSGIVAMSFVAACRAEGLGTCMMEGYDAGRLKEALGVPDRYGVPMVISAGLCGDGEEAGSVGSGRTARLSVEESVMWGRFGRVGGVEEMYGGGEGGEEKEEEEEEEVV